MFSGGGRKLFSSCPFPLGSPIKTPNNLSSGSSHCITVPPIVNELVSSSLNLNVEVIETIKSTRMTFRKIYSLMSYFGAFKVCFKAISTCHALTEEVSPGYTIR